MKTRLSFLHALRNRLAVLLPAEEQESHYRLIAEYLFRAPFHQIYAAHTLSVTPEEEETLERLLEGLAAEMPIQYLLGEAFFYNRPFRVTPAVLIPRPETEELCYHLLKRLEGKKRLKGMDLCTGSGAIAITLSLERPDDTLSALDLSAEALAVARENAAALHASVTFIEADLYAWEPAPSQEYDFIVSNPPYIPTHEAAELPTRVRNYEPALALFVPDQTPLLPYQRLATLAQQGLRQGGLLACEVHERLAVPTQTLFHNAGFAQTELLKDLQGKPRFIFAQR